MFLDGSLGSHGQILPRIKSILHRHISVHRNQLSFTLNPFYDLIQQQFLNPFYQVLTVIHEGYIVVFLCQKPIKNALAFAKKKRALVNVFPPSLSTCLLVVPFILDLFGEKNAINEYWKNYDREGSPKQSSKSSKNDGFARTTKTKQITTMALRSLVKAEAKSFDRTSVVNLYRWDIFANAEAHTLMEM